MKLSPSCKKWSAISFALVVILLIWFILTNLLLYSNDAYVKTNFISIAPQITGRLSAVYVKNNQEVKMGDPLFEIDPTPFQLTLNQDLANLAQSQASRVATTVQITHLKQQLRVADHTLQLAQNTLNRYGKLLQQKIISKQNYDDQDTLYQNAKGQQLSLRTQVFAASESLKVESAKIQSDQSAVELASYNLSLTKITAPQDGYINNLYIYPGLEVSANQALFGLVAHRDLQVIANYKEATLSKVRPGQSVWVILSSNPWHIYHGTIVSFGRAVARDATPGNAALPYIAPTTDWIRYPYRFPITIDVKGVDSDTPIAMGADARTLIWVK
jgi:multidrug efflux system membrane fusion protein